MLAQAATESPNECCGLLAGTLDRGRAVVSACFPLTNASASPTRYEAEPKELFLAFRTMREQNIEHLVIYHSHPTSEPVPSKTDLERAFYPNVVYLIMSLQHNPPLVRGWWLSETEYREAEWEVAR
jgi:proteasome lid subunit RPN8/RPN11